MKKAVVTGAAGFIGSHLVEALLAAGWKVIGIDNFDPFYSKYTKQSNISTALNHKHFTFINGDILNINRLVQSEDVDLVIHLAAKAGVRPSIASPMAYIECNINGTQAVLDFMQKKKIKKLLFASSSSVYGNNKKTPFSEDDVVDYPISPYASTKKAGELIIHTYHHLYNIDALCLRFFTVYGPRQRPDLAIHKFFRLLHEGKSITVFGDGSSSRDYTFVEDTVGGILKGIDYVSENTGVYEVVNLGNSTPVKLSDLVQKIYSISDSVSPVLYADMQPGDVDITYADINKAKALFGYDPKITMDEGLRQFYQWFISKYSNKEITSDRV